MVRLASLAHRNSTFEPKHADTRIAINTVSPSHRGGRQRGLAAVITVVAIRGRTRAVQRSTDSAGPTAAGSDSRMR